MSVETWLKEFAPVPANQAIGSDEEAIDHSILKWSGTTDEAIKKHGVHLRVGFIRDGSSFYEFTRDNCSLCQRKRNQRQDSCSCRHCLIFRLLGKICYDSDGENSAWGAFIGDNPAPMRELLAETKRKLTEQKQERKLMRYEIVPSPGSKKDDVTRIVCELLVDSCVRIRVVDAAGNVKSAGHLIALTSDGRIARVRDINPDLGFQLNKQGQVKTTDEN